MNKGVNGQFMSTMLANAPANIDPLFNSSYSLNVVIPWGCINDLSSSVTPATCYGNIQSYCIARHAVGWKCIAVTIPSSQFIEHTREQLNAMLRADHSFADAFVDFTGTPLDCDGCWSNTTWFQSDGVHPTEAAIQAFELPLFNAAVNSLIH